MELSWVKIEGFCFSGGLWNKRSIDSRKHNTSDWVCVKIAVEFRKSKSTAMWESKPWQKKGDSKKLPTRYSRHHAQDTSYSCHSHFSIHRFILDFCWIWINPEALFSVTFFPVSHLLCFPQLALQGCPICDWVVLCYLHTWGTATGKISTQQWRKFSWPVFS